MRKADPKDPVKFQKTVQKVLKRQDNMVELMTLVPWPSWPWKLGFSGLRIHDPEWSRRCEQSCFCSWWNMMKQQHLAPTLKLDPESRNCAPPRECRSCGNFVKRRTLMASPTSFWTISCASPAVVYVRFVWDELVTFLLILCGCAMTSKFV